MPLTLTDGALDWALAHAELYSDTDIFPDAFEFEAIRHEWATVRNALRGADILQWSPRAVRRCLVPKHRFGFRISTHLDPLDFLVLTALVHEVGAKLESERIPVKGGIVHSYRFEPAQDGQMFSESFTYGSFQLASQALCEAKKPSHVVVADIADFFPRLYTHRVDNALDRALGEGHMHGTALKRLIGKWAGAYSYGIPVGTAAARLIAEVTIADIDQLLLSEGIDYLRFSDDFRIFCDSEADAYRSLTLLARSLFENHGLTLQQHKTRIVSVETFRDVYLKENDKKEVETLSERFYQLLQDIGVEDTYEDIDYDSLEPEHQQALDELNLKGLLEEQIKLEEPDLSLMKFLLRRLGQVGSTETHDLIMANFQTFVPVIRETIEHLLRLDDLTDADKESIGSQLLDMYADKALPTSTLEYSRMYILRPFAVDSTWNCEDRYVQAFNESTDDFARREVILALGRSGKDFWFRARKQALQEMTPWIRRAFIYGASCLQADEYKHWVRGIDAQLDTLDRAVASWARANPITD